MQDSEYDKALERQFYSEAEHQKLIHQDLARARDVAAERDRYRQALERAANVFLNINRHDDYVACCEALNGDTE